jgi:hypothetical protein
MTVFLLEYDPAAGELVGTISAYPESQRETAQDERLRREKANARMGRHREVVLFEAVNEDALRATHSRYFKTLTELAETAPGA